MPSDIMTRRSAELRSEYNSNGMDGERLGIYAERVTE